ncbi:hypothetical protein CHS0354_022526 [Potamilus streckersoni]|uniref:Uncharacterized protein n=1 Tax=Potamilus streckersoni TaxID=2493646 RepID=A0AAE0S6U8_9BIVA|nr:hypothetical protein CHS0354_022526 [Potamilus streckersoni]
MRTIPKERYLWVLLVMPVFMIDMSDARPPRRFCENYPFAPRCLGVAAKRNIVLDESDRRKTPSALIQVLQSLLQNRISVDDGQSTKFPYQPIWRDDQALNSFTEQSSLQQDLDKIPLMDPRGMWNADYNEIE